MSGRHQLRLIVNNDDSDWMDLAECAGVDPDLFFPERGGDSRSAKAICATCPVQPECLEYALANGELFGCWGGTSERERRRLRKQRSQARSAAAS
jgi:WhiB family redox-sensing transcriptional regulator